MPERHPSVHVVIVNYRTADMCIDTLRSLVAERELLPSLCATVVDNFSDDGSAETIAQALDEQGWTDWVALHVASSNGGFAAGNNEAVVELAALDEPPDYIHLLNPDTLVRPGGVAELVRFLEDNPAVGIAGSRLEYPDGTPQRSAFRFPSLAGELENSLGLALASDLLAPSAVARPVPVDVTPADWVSGASMMVRRQVFDDVGALDTGYFLYFEETDFCLAAHRAGWSCFYVPRSRVVHLVAQATDVTSERETRRRPVYWFDSRRRYFLKNHGIGYAIAADVLRIFGVASYEARRRVLGKPSRNPPHFLGDCVRNSVFFRVG